MIKGGNRHNRRIPWRLLGGLLLLLVLVAYARANEVEVLRPQHRLGADLLAAMQAAVGDEGTVTLDQRTGALVVVGTPAAIARAKKVLAELDVAPRMVRIEVGSLAQGALASLGVDIAWSAAAGPWRVGHLRDAELLDDGGVRLRGGVTQRLDRNLVSTRQMIRVLEGETAVLVSGARAAYRPDRHAWPNAFGAPLSGGVSHVQASLLARPRIIGDEVQVELMPRVVTFGPSGMRVQQVNEMITTVRVKNGETVLLGASSTDGRSFTADLLSGLSVGAARNDMVMTLRARIEQ